MDSRQHTESLNRPLHAAGITLNSTGQFPINAAAVVQPVSIPWSNKNLDAGGAPFLLEGFAQTRLREFAESYSVGTGPTDSWITASALSKSDWSSSHVGAGKSRRPGAMARSIFKRVIKMGIKEVRKSIAALAMGNPCEKGKFQ